MPNAIEKWDPTPEKFRNANGVYMKLMNFCWIDPDYSGKGLDQGSKKDKEVWGDFISNREELRKVSDAIRRYVSSDQPFPLTKLTSDDEIEAKEGQLLTKVHRYRERDASIVKRKKDQSFKECASLICEACGFDFEKFYGNTGRGFIECHHTKPLSELSDKGETTKMSDLALVCSNCHRMIHKARPWLSINELRKLVDRPTGLGEPSN